MIEKVWQPSGEHHQSNEATPEFLVSKEAADAVRAAVIDRGEWPAVAELRRFYRIDDNAAALKCARTIASWSPLPETAVKHEKPAPRRRRREGHDDDDPC